MWRALLVLSLSAITLNGQTQPPRDRRAGQAQPPRDVAAPTSGTGSIRGRVVAADTGEPLRKARVTLGPADKAAPRIFTDDDGFIEDSRPNTSACHPPSTVGGFESLTALKN